MDVTDFVQNLNSDIKRAIMPSSYLMARMPYSSDLVKRKISYHDSGYYPFYYYLSKYLPAKTVVDLSFNVGFTVGSYVIGAERIDKVIGFQTPRPNYSTTMGWHNLRNAMRSRRFKLNGGLYAGDITDLEFSKLLGEDKYDLIFINEILDYDDYLRMLTFIWPYLRDDGWITIDFIRHHDAAKRAHADFCRMNGRENTIVKSRYGVGLIQK